MHLIFTKTRLISLAATSFCLFVFSVLLTFFIVPQVIDTQIDKNIRLERGSQQWHRFRDLPFNISINITFFEVTNGDDVVNYGVKPNLVEKGPYVFDQMMKKINLVYNEGNESVMYERSSQLFFNSSKTDPSLRYDDTVNILNPAYMAAMQMYKDFQVLGPVGAGRLDHCLKGMFPEGLFFKNIPIRKILFEGVKLCDFKAKFCNFFMVQVCHDFINKSITLEEINDSTGHYIQFSLLGYKLKKTDGTYEIESGMRDVFNTGSILTWNYDQNLNIWDSTKMNNSCNDLRGSFDGSLFPPHISKGRKITIYASDLCRTVDFYYSGIRSYNDIDGYYFKPDTNLYYSTAPDLSKDCYCLNRTLGFDGNSYCYTNGVLDLFPCMGAPVLLSNAHYLHADKMYSNGLDGDIAPDEQKHGSFLLLDKYTGVPLQVHVRVQINFVLRKVQYFGITNNLPSTLLPVIWLDEGLDLPEQGLDLLNSLLYDTLTFVKILEWLFMGSTLGLTIMTSIFLCRHFYSSE